MIIELVFVLGVQSLAPTEAEDTAPVEAASKVEDQEIEIEVRAPWILPADTPVHLMVLNEVTTKSHQAGHKFKLRVNKPVMLDGQVVIPVGATAWGEVTSADDSGNVGKSGKLAANLLYVEANGSKYSISGGTTSKGKSGTAETVMGVLALGPFGLFAKGNNAKIKAGELMTAFTVDDVEIPRDE
ncbi:hypothetical protein [Sphingorhabdus sp. EL138]|uniref:hypothetical protein n=1 Tax=Sphingorhabdus sp. EL138 TaxID=2073156 RepID=UPI000D68E8BD|nr:hypothetical protein [Sphingorhabdus sp. EL138]